MNTMRSIVGDVAARLRADFADGDLYMCWGAMDLAAWQSVYMPCGRNLNSRRARC
jgi:hypothetical protein